MALSSVPDRPDQLDRSLLPFPGWNAFTEGHWLAAGQGRLAVQRCSRCGAHRWPPNPACYHCTSMEWDWADLPGTGTVYSYTWVDEPPQGVMAVLGTYNITIVELDGVEGEPVRMMGRVVDIEKDDLVCGLRVNVDFEPIDAEIARPVWRAAR